MELRCRRCILEKWACLARSCIPRRTQMKRALLAGLTAVAVFAGTQAFAQAVSATIDMAPEQRTKIKEYVVKEKVAPVTIKERVSVGATLPATVQLRSV